MSKTDFLTTYLSVVGVQMPATLLFAETEQGDHQSNVEDQQKASPDTICSFNSLTELSKHIEDCQHCDLAENRHQLIFGSGNDQADLVLIGEAPNPNEEQQGIPFVDDTGELFASILKSIGLQREQVYVLNIVKCQPLNHRDPTHGELEACRNWLDMQLDLIQPKVICLLGRVAAQGLLKCDTSLRELRDQWFTYKGVPTYVSYHPAYLLRSPRQKRESWKDFQAIQQKLEALD